MLMGWYEGVGEGGVLGCCCCGAIFVVFAVAVFLLMLVIIARLMRQSTQPTPTNPSQSSLQGLIRDDEVDKLRSELTRFNLI